MPEFNIPKTYDFSSIESRIYHFWESEGYFKPWNDPMNASFDPSITPFVISIPPPNITGELHLGHAMVVSIEDLMIRYHRMKGIPTLWIPGTDHASIATQLQVEKSLKSEGLTREQVGREEFLRRCWVWKAKFGGIILQQTRRLGASCDWDRERFTMDEGLSQAVREAFVRLYENGLIYRGPRMINWSPGLRTAISDLEVENFEEPGTLFYFKYRLTDSDNEFIPVATTRPETILGDTAVAVHPDDLRYQQYIGRQVIVPILGRNIPVITDEYVNPEFATGALKITPGHDPNDYRIGQKHDLPVISILDEHAHINVNGGPYTGQDRFEARNNIWKDMKTADLVIKEEPYMINVPRSQRGGEIVEPMVSTQWFVKIEPLAHAALNAVKNKQIKIVPERFEKDYFNWLENIEDWCISRQLWWGHRIPVWYCADCGEMTVTRHDPTSCSSCGKKNLEQDPDVLDTWFSSALWPFSTLGWPFDTSDYRYFYPTSTLETAYDILFFWVARMIMAGLEFTGKIPFNTVYLHGLIRDEKGRKMSKTAGNTIDPLEVIDKYGTDALRFTLLVGSTPGNDTNISMQKVIANRNFANKIWNAGRFVIAALSTIEQIPQETNYEPTLADSWIKTRLRMLLSDMERLFQNYQYGEAGRQVYEFFWGDFADWYIEIAKLQLKLGGDPAYHTARTLVQTMDICLRLLHPFTPFVTEELWGYLKQAVEVTTLSNLSASWSKALIVASWPEPTPEESGESTIIADFSQIQDVVVSIRNYRSEKNIPPANRIPAIFVSPNAANLLKCEIEIINALSGLNPHVVTILEDLTEKPQGFIPLVVGKVEIYLPGTGRFDKVGESKRLYKELDKIKQQINRLENLLEGPFSMKAPSDIVEKERQKLQDYQLMALKLENQLSELKNNK